MSAYPNRKDIDLKRVIRTRTVVWCRCQGAHLVPGTYQQAGTSRLDQAVRASNDRPDQYQSGKVYMRTILLVEEHRPSIRAGRPMDPNLAIPSADPWDDADQRSVRDDCAGGRVKHAEAHLRLPRGQHRVSAGSRPLWQTLGSCLYEWHVRV